MNQKLEIKNYIEKVLLIIVLSMFCSFELAAQEVCNNGKDDDGDGLVDCYDADCKNSIDCQEFYYGGVDPTCSVTYVFNPVFGLTRVWKGATETNGNIPLIVADMDNDGVPEVIAARRGANEINILNGQTGILETVAPASLHDFSQGVGVIDAKSDGTKEIFLVNTNGILYGYGANGSGIPSFQTLAVGYNVSHAIWNPQFADFDEDGFPELYVGNQIYSTENGAKLAEAGVSASRGAADGDLLSTEKEHNNSFAADVLPDDFCLGCEGVELICGNEVYSVVNNGGSWLMNLESSIESKGNYRDGKVSVADWDGDNRLDIIVSSVKDDSDALIYIWNPIDTTLISNSADGGSLASNPFNPNSLLATSIFSARLGVLMIADIDNDGRPEMGGAGSGAIFMLDEHLNELWSKTVNNGMGLNSMTSFDFEGDGAVEVVYQTHDSVLILDANNGSVKASYACTSLSDSRLQTPVVADVTADGQANIICSCGNSATPTYSEVHVLNSVTNDWKPTRQFWNQFSFSPTSVDDDLKIIAEAQDPLKIAKHNTFLVQKPFLATNGNSLWLTENCDSVRLIIAEGDVNNDWYPEYGEVINGTCESDLSQTSLRLDYPTNAGDLVLRAYSASGVGDLTSLDFTMATIDFNQDIQIKIVDTSGFVMIDTLLNISTEASKVSLDLSAYENSSNLIKTISLAASNNASFCIESIKFSKNAKDVSSREVNVGDLKIISRPEGVIILSELAVLESVSLYSLKGELINYELGNGKTLEFTTSHLSKGIYILDVNLANRKESHRIKLIVK